MRVWISCLGEVASKFTGEEASEGDVSPSSTIPCSIAWLKNMHTHHNYCTNIVNKLVHNILVITNSLGLSLKRLAPTASVAERKGAHFFWLVLESSKTIDNMNVGWGREVTSRQRYQFPETVYQINCVTHCKIILKILTVLWSSPRPLPIPAIVSCVARRRAKCRTCESVPAAAIGVYVAWNWAGATSGSITCRNINTSYER